MLCRFAQANLLSGEDVYAVGTPLNPKLSTTVSRGGAYVATDRSRPVAACRALEKQTFADFAMRVETGSAAYQL